MSATDAADPLKRPDVPGSTANEAPTAGVGESSAPAGVGSLSMAARLEGLLFVADGPIPVGRLAEVLEIPAAQVERALAELEAEASGRGLRLLRSGGQVQLVTAPELAPLIERMLGLQSQMRCSPAALETLAIIAYRQPITRPEIEAVRGVNCDGVLRTLLSAGLIEEVGRAPTVGRPILFGTTFEFLQRFGLRSLYDLPPLDLPTHEAGSSAQATG